MVGVRSNAVRHALITSLAICSMAAPAYAQAPAQQREAELRERQQLVVFMDDLRRSVNVGATEFLRQIRLETPRADLELANPVEVEMFKLDEGGLLFRVRVPSMLPAFRIAWELLQPPRVRRPGTVTPTNLTPASTAGPAATASQTSTVQVLPAQPSPYTDIDPDEVYTREVKAALMNTLIQGSKGIRIPPGQRLTIAARDDGRPNPNFPSSYTEFNTVYFSIKGSDLAAFHEGRQTLEETQKLVTVRED
jgi:hypothetical protein